MRELSMHILDLAQNSISAGAALIEIDISVDTESDALVIAIQDDGRGMSPEFLDKVRDPFTTTRTTRRVGMGIPMFEEAARSAGGALIITSEPGEGTYLIANFGLSHIDRAPIGDIAATMIALIGANPDIRFIYNHRKDGKAFTLDTDEVKAELDGVPINEPSVLMWLQDYIKSQTGGEMEIS